MMKKILSVLLMTMILFSFVTAFAEPVAQPATTEETVEDVVIEEVPEEITQEPEEIPQQEYVPIKEQFAEYIAQSQGEDKIVVKDVVYNAEEETVSFSIVNTDTKKYQFAYVIEGQENAKLGTSAQRMLGSQAPSVIEAGKEIRLTEIMAVDNFDAKKGVKLNVLVQYMDADIYTEYDMQHAALNVSYYECDAELEKAAASAGKDSEGSTMEGVINFLKQTGFYMIYENVDWGSVVMILIACLLLWLAIVKKFEPLLLLPIAFGMLLTNLLGAEIFHEELFAGGHVHWEYFGHDSKVTPGLIDILYLGVKLGIYPCLIFIGVGAMTDFGPLIANPKSLLLGAAAQIGIFATFLAACYIEPVAELLRLPFEGFTMAEAGSIGIIGGADGPTAIFLTSKLAPHLLGPIAVAAYSYMALVPVIQPPIMKLLTTKEERCIAMRELRPVSKTEKIVFPIITTVFVALLVPSAAPLVGSLMLGNLLKESGVCERLSKTVQNELMNIVTVFLGISVGATATASTFLAGKTIMIIIMGVIAFGVATACGVLLAKVMNLFLKEKINPLIGSAGVSAVPMAARVSQTVGQEANPSNFLLMHAMGPNVAGVIGSAIAAGALLALLG